MHWAAENPEDWYAVCHPESLYPKLEDLAALIQKLRRENLYTVLSCVLYANEEMRGLHRAVIRTVSTSLLELPLENLIDRLCQELENEVQKGPQEERDGEWDAP